MGEYGIDGVGSYVDGEFQFFPARCHVRDDGVFELPDDVLEALAALPGETTVRYATDFRRIEFRDGVVAFHIVDIADD